MIDEIPMWAAIPLILVSWALWLGPAAARAVAQRYARPQAPNQTNRSEHA